MAYMLGAGEKVPPQPVQQVFNTLVQAIEKGAATMRPGLPGHKIDQVVRQTVLKNSYPDYNHGTGHPVGRVAHDAGTFLGPKGRPRTALSLQMNGVYTLEPRIAIPNGGSIEEMVVVKEEGAEFISPRQTEIILIAG